MPTTNGYQQSFLWDDVHVLIVNYQRQEVYLYENAGGEPGVFHIKTAESQARARLTDPFEILDLATRFAIRFELLVRVLDAEVTRVFEAIGVKDFLSKLVSTTTEQMRRNRFNGLGFFEFTVNVDQKVNGASATELDDEYEDEEDEPETVETPTPPVTAATSTGRTRRKSSAAATAGEQSPS